MLKHKNNINQYFNGQISAILSMVQFINSISKLNNQWKFLIKEINNILSTDHTIFYAFNEKTNVLTARYSTDGEITQIQKPAIFGIAEYVIRSGKILKVDKSHKFPYLQKEISYIGQSRIESFLILPLTDKNDNVLGCIQVANKKGNEFTEDDVSYLMMIATLVPNIFHKTFHKSKEMPLHDIKRAEKTQRQLLPANVPDIPGYDVYAFNKPSEFVGGDYFDFFQFPGRLSFVVSDVAGKGVSAALLMANMQAFLHAFVNENETSWEIVNKVNRHFYSYSAAEMFATFFVANLNHNAHLLNYVNAGHIPPVLIRKGNLIENLSSGGVPVGMVESHDYKEFEIFIQPGDILIIVSDGILEAMNSKGKFFGRERLEKICLQNSHLNVNNLGKMIVDHVKAFSGNNKKTDDQTIMIVKRNEEVLDEFKPNKNIIFAESNKFIVTLGL